MPSRAAAGGMDRKAEEEPIVVSMGDDDNAARRPSGGRVAGWMTSEVRPGMPLVAVLGNGPVGQTTALMLARWGVPVVLLDQRPHRDAVGSKSIVQQRDVLDAWAAVGAGRRIADEGLTWTTARTFYRDAELFTVTF